MTSIRTLVDSILVPHTAFETGLQRLEQSLNYVRDGGHEPTCHSIIGESRAGKSRLCERLLSCHPMTRHDTGLHVPVLFAVVPSLPTVKGMVELLLKNIGAKDWDRTATENVKTAQLVTLIRKCGVVMLALDEFHHFYDKGSRKVQHHVADWLKNLITDTRIALTVSGLKILEAVIDQNEQLSGRFGSPIEMPRFDWFNLEHRSEWFSILEAFGEGLSSHFDLPALHGDELALRIYCGTGGLIGYLCKTLRQAVWDALDAGTRTITVESLQRAHQASVWSRERNAELPNPFDRGHLVYPSQEVIAQAKLIGTPKPEEPRPKKRSSGRVQNSSSSSTGVGI